MSSTLTPSSDHKFDSYYPLSFLNHIYYLVISSFSHTFVINSHFLQDLLKYFFREQPRVSHFVGSDPAAMYSNIIGDAGIFLFFLTISLCCFLLAKTTVSQEAYKERRKTSWLFGACMLCCSLSRGLNVLALWHNFYFLNGIIKLLGTAFSFMLVIYIPYVVRSVKNARQLEKVKQSMINTTQKMEELKTISAEILNK